METTAMQRLKMLYLLDYLKENTRNEYIGSQNEVGEHKDNEYAVSRKDAMAYLNKMGIESRRTSFNLDIKVLEDYYRMDYHNGEYHLSDRIVEIKKDSNTYSLPARKYDFTLQELHFLVDSVQSSRFFTQEMADRIVEKIKALASKYERKLLERHNYIAHHLQSGNENGLLNVGKIYESINKDCKIAFDYYHYNVKKKREYNKIKHEVSPYALQISDNNYYLIAREYSKIKHFRIDKMESIDMLIRKKRHSKEDFDAYKLAEQEGQVFSMFRGKKTRVHLRFQKQYVDYVLERFGHNIRIDPVEKKEEDETGKIIVKETNYFTVWVDVEVGRTFYGWLLGFETRVKVLAPESVVDEFSTYVSKVSRMYKVDKVIRKREKAKAPASEK